MNTQARLTVRDEEPQPGAEKSAPRLRVVEVAPEAVEPPTAPAPGYSGVPDHSTPLHSFIEHSMLFSFLPLFAAVLYLSAARLYELELLWLVALAVPLSFVLGDLVTGVVHWAADTYGTEKTPVVGQSLIKPFRLHHLYPKDICTHNVVVTLGNSCILGVPLMALCLFFLLGEDVSGWLAFITFAAAVLALVTVATNQFHKWAHQDEPARLVRWLQRSRVVLSPQNHQTHHTVPYDKYYCITNGWLNSLLNKLKFFRALETMLRRMGVRPTGRKD